MMLAGAMSGNRDLYLAGTGSFSQEVAEWANEAGWTVAGRLELGGRAAGGRIADPPILDRSAIPAGSHVAIAAGGDRAAHHGALGAAWFVAGTVIHPLAHVSPSARLGPGCIVGPRAVVGAGATVGEHTLISRGALLGHHVRVGSFASLLPGINIGGNAQVGDRAVVGMGAVIVNATSVGSDVTVAAGAVVLKAVPDGRRVQGVPAREYRT